MIRLEFAEWREHVKTCFPQSTKTVEGLTKETRDIWFQSVFARVTLEEAKAATERLVGIGMEHYDFASLPSKVYEQVLLIRDEASISAPRRNSDDVGGVSRPRKRSEGLTGEIRGSMDSVMKGCLGSLGRINRRRKSEGNPVMTGGEVREFVDQFFRENDSQVDYADEQPRYSCSLCQDSGFVAVWSTKAMLADLMLLRNEIADLEYRRSHRTVHCACSCEIGEQRSEIVTYRDGRRCVKRGVARFDAETMVRAPQDHGDKMLREWAESFVGREAVA